MIKIRNIAKMVKEALIHNTTARNSDDYLYYLICSAKMKSLGMDIKDISFAEGLLNRNHYGLPNFETVRRTRQKIQQTHPELAGNDEVEAMRTINENIFREYARKG